MRGGLKDVWAALEYSKETGAIVAIFPCRVQMILLQMCWSDVDFIPEELEKLVGAFLSVADWGLMLRVSLRDLRTRNRAEY